MFKNRAIQVRMIKTDEADAEEAPSEEIYTETIATATASVDHLMTKAAKFIGGYVILDTARKVIVALASK